MTKITAVLLGVSLTLATAGLSLAGQTTPAPADSSAPTAKKHVKKNKKASTKANPAAPAASSTQAAPAK
jgi:hypothetical protein